MKIALINQPWNEINPPVQSGSIAIWTDRIAHQLAQSGDDVTVYGRIEGAPGPAETYGGVEYRRARTRADELAARGLKRITKALRRGRRRPPFSAGWYYRGYIHQIARDLRARGADVVHVPNFSQFVPVLRAALPEARIVLHMHSEWLAQLDPSLLAGRLAQADLIVGCSDHITSLGRAAFPELEGRFQTVYNGVDEQMFSPAAQPRQNGKKLLFVGRISPEKGLHVLMAAFRQVSRHCPGTTLEIVGPDSVAPRDYLVSISDDPLLAGLEMYYALGDYPAWLRQNKPAEVTFSGPVPYEQLPDIYRAASVLVNPSFSETFGMSLIEGMAAGLPAVATRVGGAKEVVVDGQTGLLVEAGQVEPLAEAIISILEKPTPEREALGRAGRERVLNLFTWPRVVESLKRLYLGEQVRL